MGGLQKVTPPSLLPLPLFLLTPHSQISLRKCRAVFPTLETLGANQSLWSSAHVPALTIDFSQMSVKIRFNYIVKNNPEEVYFLLK